MSDSRATPAPRQILLVEDDHDSSRSLTRLLELEGFQVTAVPTANDALVLLDRDPAPNCMITDVQLPDLDGRDLARRAKARRPGLRIALVTGWDLGDDQENLDALGVDAILLKPFSIRSLLDWIKDCPAA